MEMPLLEYGFFDVASSVEMKSSFFSITTKDPRMMEMLPLECSSDTSIIQYIILCQQTLAWTLWELLPASSHVQIQVPA